MPIVTVTARPHPTRPRLLAAVADAVAGAIGLGPGEVIAMAIDTASAMANGGASLEGDWLIVSIHGSDRGKPASDAARAAAGRAAADWGRANGIDIEGVWTEWILPQTMA